MAPPPGELGRTRPPGAGERPPRQPREAVRPARTKHDPQPEFEQKPEPTHGKPFPCANCGASLRYSPGVSSLTCEYCGHVQEIPQSEDQVHELSFEKYFEAGTVPVEVLEAADGETRCPGCGANVVITAHTAKDSCPFCGSNLTNPIEAAQPMMRPGGVLPFAVEQDSARSRFRKWVKSRWFAPNEFKQLDKLNRLNGLYVPYWTYDFMTFNFYTGQRGEAYYVTVGSGDNRRRERRIRWYPVSGMVSHFFDDVLVCASNTLPEKLIEKLEPWDLHNVQPYNDSYLSGFRTERYQVDLRHGFQCAREIADTTIRNLVERDIGGDEQRISSIRTQCEGITFKLVLLPVWLAAYRFKEKTYRVLINASTGEVQGERPWSWLKITLTALGALAVVAPLIHFLVATFANR